LTDTGEFEENRNNSGSEGPHGSVHTFVICELDIRLAICVRFEHVDECFEDWVAQHRRTQSDFDLRSTSRHRKKSVECLEIAGKKNDELRLASQLETRSCFAKLAMMPGAG
jgi:hypothetical protein